MAIDKPAGLLVHRSMLDKHETQFAVQLLRDQIDQHVFPLHRLDRPTSGVLIFALSADIARACGEQFSQQQIHKSYLAIVRGHTPESAVIDYPLKEQLDKIADKQARQDKAAQAALTEYQSLHHFELPFAVGRYPSARYSLVALKPKTGRKHQLRRHMKHIFHPIVGDTTHGDGKHNSFLQQQFDLNGLALSCVSMQMRHPVSQQNITFCCPPSGHISQLLVKWGLSEQQVQQLVPVPKNESILKRGKTD